MALVAVNIYDDSHTKVSKLDEDIFIEMAKEIYIKTGFVGLNTYYHQLKKSKNEIVSILLNHYTYIDDNDIPNINKSFEKMQEIKDGILNCIIKIFNEHATNITFLNILDYFNTITIKDLNHYENGDMIISKLHFEWLERIRQLEYYYRTVDKDKDECLVKHKKHKKGMLGWVRHALEYSKPATYNHLQSIVSDEPSSDEPSSDEPSSDEQTFQLVGSLEKNDTPIPTDPPPRINEHNNLFIYILEKISYYISDINILEYFNFDIFGAYMCLCIGCHVYNSNIIDS